MITIKIGKKTYSVEEAFTQSEHMKGLQGRESLDDDKGMLFYFDPPQEVSMWMSNVNIPLDIIYIDEEQVVQKVYKAIPNNKRLVSCPETAFVLEVNYNSGVKVGDELEFENEDPVMYVLAQDGESQYELYGGERIVSRRETRVLIKKAKKADMTKSLNDYKALGKYMFKVLKGQNTRPPEYVESPD